MALWRLVETAVGRSTDAKSQRAASEVLNRAKAFALAVVYFALAYSAFGFARGAGKATGEQNSGISARLMQTGAGTVTLIGVVIVAVGGYHIYRGASQNFLGDQRLGAATGHGGLRRQRPGHRRGRNTGHRRGHSYGVGQGDRNRRRLENTWGQPYGAALLIAACLGIVTYGLYSFVTARYTKM